MGGDNFVLGGVSGISQFPSNGEKPGWTVYVNMGKLDIFFLLLLLIPEASTFGPTIFGFRSLQRPHIRFRRHTHLAVNDEESGGSSGSEGNVGKSFGEVEAALVEEAEEKAKERTGMEQFREEERALFASKSEEISLIQQEISSRASNLGIKGKK